tara:strand:- start:11098 stop:11685 length:588 start_codon:yes stop_codon:yes gene_type:complete
MKDISPFKKTHSISCLDFYKLLEDHDWTFCFSDDAEEYKGGNENLRTIKLICELNSKANELYFLYKSHVLDSTEKPDKLDIEDDFHYSDYVSDGDYILYYEEDDGLFHCGDIWIHKKIIEENYSFYAISNCYDTSIFPCFDGALSAAAMDVSFTYGGYDRVNIFPCSVYLNSEDYTINKKVKTLSNNKGDKSCEE